MYWKIFKPRKYSYYKYLSHRYQMYGGDLFITLMTLKAPVNLNIYAPSEHGLMTTVDYVLK
ncbi:hypothetical protein LCGC14_1987680 [marine sediment metagenome]|uniref:Uncharacterized protein n=1 Tax=marine sediment metagenome TaxID=412755 RepID=A0A0F9I428_9ZZZZ